MSGIAEVRALVRAHGRGRRTWSDRYITLLAVGLLVVIGAPLIGRAIGSLPADVDPARAGAGLALAALLLAGALVLARALGPVAVPAADAAWLVLSPLPRRSVLARTLLVLAALGAGVGAVVGLALLSALGVPDAVTLRLLAAVLLGVAWSVGGVAATVLAQVWQPWDGAVVALLAALVVAAAAAALMGTGPGHGVLTAIAAAPASAWTAAASASVAASAVLAGRAWAAVARMPARAVLAASTRTGHAAGALVLMDPGALTWIAEDAHWRSRVLRSRAVPSRLRGAAAIAWLDWRRLARQRGRLALLAASPVLPLLAAQAGLGAPGALAALAVGASAAAAAGTAGARRDTGDPALARLLGAAARPLLAGRAVLPALLGGAWLTAALAGLDAAGLGGGPFWPLGPLCAPALAAGALRMARRRPIEHGMPVLDTPLGTVPTGPFLWALAGADIAVLGCLPALIAFTGGVSAPLLAAQAVVGAAVLAVYCAAPRRA